MSHIYIHDAQGRKYRQPVTVVESRSEGVPPLVVPHMVSTTASGATSGSSTGGLFTAVTLVANSSGALYLDGVKPEFTLVPGHRYAWMIQNWEDHIAGEIIPQLDGVLFPTSATDESPAVLKYDFSGLGGGVKSVGFEFVATGTVFYIGSRSFTEGDEVKFILVEIV